MLVYTCLVPPNMGMWFRLLSRQSSGGVIQPFRVLRVSPAETMTPAFCGLGEVGRGRRSFSSQIMCLIAENLYFVLCVGFFV